MSHVILVVYDHRHGVYAILGLDHVGFVELLCVCLAIDVFPCISSDEGYVIRLNADDWAVLLVPLEHIMLGCSSNQ